MSVWIKGMGGCTWCKECTNTGPCQRGYSEMAGAGESSVNPLVFTAGTYSSLGFGYTNGDACWTYSSYSDGGSGVGFDGFNFSGTPGTPGDYVASVTFTNCCGPKINNVYIRVISATCPALCPFSASGGSGGMDSTVSCSTSSGFSVSASIDLTNARCIIYANGVSIYDSGCVTSVSYPTITFPAGTTTVRIYVDTPCSGDPGNAFVIDWTC